MNLKVTLKFQGHRKLFCSVGHLWSTPPFIWCLCWGYTKNRKAD